MDNKKCDNVEELFDSWINEQTLWDKIVILMKTPYWRFRDFKFALKTNIARFRKGYAPVDTWGMNSWFIDTVVKILNDFKNNLNGHPSNLTEEKWDEILNEMYEGFIITQKVLNDHAIFDTDYKKANVRLLKHYKKYKYEIVSEEKHNKAFQLFHEYFFNLWD